MDNNMEARKAWILFVSKGDSLGMTTNVAFLQSVALILLE